MKDSKARDCAKGLSDRLNRLESEKPREKDCPVCGHVTLMKQGWTCGYKTDFGFIATTTWGPLGVRNDTPQYYYCYGCGKTFIDGTTLTEVEDKCK